MLPARSSLRRLALAHFGLECQFWFPTWVLFLDHRGFDLATMVLADAAFRLTVVGAEFPMGVLSDRIGRRSSFLLLSALGCVTYLSIALVYEPTTLFITWVLWGVFWALSSGLTSAYAYELVDVGGSRGDVTHILGLMRSVSSAAALVSHLAAGFLFTLAAPLPFVVSGVLALASLVIVSTLPDTPRSSVEPSSLRLSLALRSLFRRHSSLLFSLALLSLTTVYFWSPRILMQPLFLELSLTPISVSLIYFFYSFAGVVAGLIAHRAQQSVGTRGTILWGITLLWVGVLFIGLVPGRGTLFFFPLLSFGYYLAYVILETVIHAKVSNRHRASVLSASSLVASIFILAARSGLGLMADWVGALSAFVTWALIGGALVPLFALLIRTIENGVAE